MKYTNTPVSAPESTILAADTYVAIPFTVKETNAVPAGYPMAKTGLKAAATTGTSADVYPVIYIAGDCAAVTPLKGANALTPFVKNPGESREGDQLGQRGWIGWKSYFAALILSQVWIARVECAIPEL